MFKRLAICGLLALAGCQDAPAVEHGSRPNILLIIADDLGYTDLGYFGAEIRTPNIDRLAETGLVLTDFYASPVCGTTRAMLLSGMSNQQAGFGSMAPMSMYPENSPHYQGVMTDRVLSVAKRMQDLDYQTYMTGKWHLGYSDELSPRGRGFTRSFALLQPGGSHWGDMGGLSFEGRSTYRMDGEIIDSLPEDFYSTIAYTDHMIDFIDEGEDDKPFFGYLAYTAPHWPLQALDEDIAAQAGRFDEGYDVIRQRRFEAWKELGFGPADLELPPDPPGYPSWDSLNDEEKAISIRSAEVYAAMVERMDSEIGRLLDHLEETGKLDNTIVIFISDNGAEQMQLRPAGFDYSLENIGRPNSFASIGPGWAEAGSAPLYLRKNTTAEGGIKVPAIISGPALGIPHGHVDALSTVMDFGPTFVDLAGGENSPGGTASLAMTGHSLVGLLNGSAQSVRSEDEYVAMEIGGNRMIRRGPWKAEWMFAPLGDSTWQLYNLDEDPSQRENVAEANPELVAELAAQWDEFAEENGVIVMDVRRNMDGTPVTAQ